MSIWRSKATRAQEATKGPSAAELRAALEELERPKADLYEVSEVPRWAEIYSKQGLHPGLWAFIAVPAASLAGRLAWLREGQRGPALERARALIDSNDEAELKRFARRNLRERFMLDEIFWRPWLAPRMKVEGIEHLDKSRKRRGTILAGVHAGPIPHLQLRIAIHLQRDGKTLYIARRTRIEDERKQTGSRAHYAPSLVERLEAAGARFVAGEDSTLLLRELLKRRETCWIPASRAAEIATLSRETNSPVLPAAAQRSMWRPRGQILDPLQPRNFSRDEELQAKLEAIAGELIAANRAQVTAGADR